MPILTCPHFLAQSECDRSLSGEIPRFYVIGTTQGNTVRSGRRIARSPAKMKGSACGRGDFEQLEKLVGKGLDGRRN